MSGSHSNNIEQLLYTSCRQGLGDGPGFQTQAISPGLGSRERYELESLPTYKYPRRLNQSADQAEVKRFCPPNLLFKKLPSGSDALTRYVYAGVDYSGRWGNFLSHSLLLPDKASQEFRAIDFATWPDWYEAVSTEPPVLSSISLPSVRLNTRRFATEELSAFIRSNLLRQQQFPQMLAALWQSRAANRPVFVRDQVDNLATWVACLTKILPARLGNYFSFSTFVNARLADVDIQCTTADSDIEVNSEMLHDIAFTFDFVDCNFSEIEIDPESYYAFACQMLVDQPRWFDKLNDFCELLDCDLQMEMLPEILLSFRLSNGEQLSGPRQVELIPQTLQFVGASLKKRNESNLVLDAILEAAMKAQAADQAAWNRKYMQSLVALAGGERPSYFAKIAWSSCLKLFYGEFLSAAPDWRQLLAMLEQAGTGSGLSPQSLRHELVKACNSKALLTQLDEKSSACLAEFLMELLSNPVSGQATVRSRSHGHTVNLAADRPEVQLVKQIFHERASIRLAMQIFEKVASAGDGAQLVQLLEAVIDDAPSRDSIDSLGTALANILSAQPPKQAATLRRRLAEAGLYELLGAELKHLGKQVGENNQALVNVLVASQKNWIGHDHTLGAFVDDIWRSLPANKKRILAMQFWDALDILQQLPDHILGPLAFTMGAIVSLKADETPEARAIEKLYLLCESRRLPIQIRLEMRRMVDRVTSGRLRTMRTFHREWQELKRSKEPVDPKTGVDVVQRLLGPLLGYCQSASETRQTIEWGRSTADTKTLEATLVQVLSSRGVADWPLEAAGSFVIVALTDFTDDKVAAFSVRNLETWLLEIDKAVYAQLDTYMEKHKVALPEERLNDWRQLYLRSRSQRASLVGRVLRMPWLKKLMGS